MSKETDQIIAGHEYDGIQELDNPMPDWWLYIFFGTIVFAFIYWVHYEFGTGPNQAQELEQSLVQIKSLKKGGPVLTEEKLTAAFTDEAVKGGQQVYAAKCAVCHGPEGGGLIGPNLTDSFWLHGTGARADIAQVISAGVLDKGMPAWSEQISENELVQVSAFVFSLKGKNIAGGKPPQGQEVK